VAEPAGEALVARAVVLPQGGARFLGHGAARARVAAFKDGMAAVGQPQELKHAVVGGHGVGEEGVAVDDVDDITTPGTTGPITPRLSMRHSPFPAISLSPAPSPA